MLAQRLIRAEAEHQVDQTAIVGHVFGDVRMRKVRSPQHAIRRGFDQGACEGNGVVEGAFADRDALRTAYLDQGQGIVAHQRHQQAEWFLFDALCGLHAAHVVDDEGYADLRQYVLQLDDIVGVQVQHHVPAHLGHAVKYAPEHAHVRTTTQVLDEIEPDSAYTTDIQRDQARLVDM